MILFALSAELRSSKLELDEGLIDKVAEGDMTAFERLYRATDKVVYGYILSFLRNHHDAEDVMHDTYCRIRAAAGTYQHYGKPMAWIFTIARNLCLMKLRVKSRESDGEEPPVQISESSDNTVVDNIVLKAALEILSVEERQIVVLHAVSGMKHREIAQNLDLTMSSVLSKYSRALKKLKKHLTERGAAR